MDGLMMDYQLTLPPLLRRAETYFGDKEVATRLPDRSFHRYTYRDMARRAKQLAVALQKLGLQRGDRVATLSWNHYQHLECYFGIPCGGFVLHTLNLRLHPRELAYIARHAGDRAVIVDESLLPLLDQFREETLIEHVFVVESSYEELLAGAGAGEWRDPNLRESEAAAMCYTTGTTGRPKGVVYSHRSTILHALGVPFGHPMSEPDVVLPVVPMFHANAWGYPYLAAAAGAKLVFPGPHVDPESLLDDFEQERVTWAAGIPTIWHGLLRTLDSDPGRWDLSSLKGMLVGGAAVPRSLIAAFKQRYGVTIHQGWGMTETSPVATVTKLVGELGEAGEETKLDFAAMAGIPLPLVEVRARLGEWISSVDLENALVAHPAVVEAAVIAVPDARWGERPLACVVLRPDATVSAEELRDFLAADFAKWQLPDRFEFLDEIPKTSVGKLKKSALRERFAQLPAPS